MTILAPNGKSARAEMRLNAAPRASAYATPSTSPGMNQYMQRRRWGSDKVIHAFQHSELLEYSRQTFCRNGNVAAAVTQKAEFAVGDAWLPQSLAADKVWAKIAEKWLHEQVWPMCDVRGPAFDFTSNLFLESIALDVEADSLMILTEADSHFPQVQFVPAGSIGNSIFDITEGKVKDGEFKGLNIESGVIYDDSMRPMAYRVKQRDGTFQDVSAYNAQMLFEPDLRGQIRGIPKIGKELLSWWSREDICKFLERAVKLESSIGVLRHTKGGRPPVDMADALEARTDTTEQPVNVPYENIEGGEIFYLNASENETIDGFKGERPHPNTEAFLARLERQGILAIGWYVELLDPKQIGGASMRAIQNLARQKVRNRQRTLRKRAERFTKYAIAKGIKHGFIPDTKDLGKYQWTFTLPAELTVDEGYSRAADIEDYKLGIKSKSELCARGGRWYEDVSSQCDSEVEDLIARAQAIAKIGRAHV